MAMRSSNSPRRVYSRKGTLVVCFSGVYFGPGKEASNIDPEKEVKIEVLDASHGKKRIKVTQKIGKKPAVMENWGEKKVTFTPRASATA